MAPHAGSSQRVKSRVATLHQTLPSTPLRPPPDSDRAHALEEFFLDPTVWRATGLQGPLKMQVPFDHQKLLHPEPRAPRMGWFPGEQHTAVLLPPAYAPSRGADRQPSFHAQQEALPHPPAATGFGAAQPFSHYTARQPAATSSPSPPPAPAAPAMVQQLAPSPPPLWERPDLQTLLQGMQRRTRSSKARQRCSADKLGQRLTWLMQPAPPPPEAPAPPPPELSCSVDPALPGGLAALEMALLAQIMPGVATHAPLGPPPPIQLPAAMQEADSPVPAEAEPQVTSSGGSQQQLPSRASAVAVTPQAGTPGRVPIILLPANGQVEHLPAVCLSPAPPRPTATPRVWDSAPAPMVLCSGQPTSLPSPDCHTEAVSAQQQQEPTALPPSSQLQQPASAEVCGTKLQVVVTDVCTSKACPGSEEAATGDEEMHSPGQEVVTPPACPPTNSNASSQHGEEVNFTSRLTTSLSSCGSDVAMHLADISDEKQHEQQQQQRQSIVTGCGGGAGMVLCGKAPPATSPPSPSSPLSDVDMMAA